MTEQDTAPRMPTRQEMRLAADAATHAALAAIQQAAQLRGVIFPPSVCMQALLVGASGFVVKHARSALPNMTDEATQRLAKELQTQWMQVVESAMKRHGLEITRVEGDTMDGKSA